MHDLLAKDNSVFAFLSQTFQKHVFSDETALPCGIETYSKDFHNLPLTQTLKEQLDTAFFSNEYDQQRESNKSFLMATNNSTLAKEIQKHVSVLCSNLKFRLCRIIVQYDFRISVGKLICALFLS